MGIFNLKKIFGSEGKETSANSMNSTAATARPAATQKPLTYCVEATKVLGAETDAIQMMMRLTGNSSVAVRRILSSTPVVFMKDLDRGDAEFVKDRLKEAGVSTAIYPSSALNQSSRLVVSPNAVDRIYVEKVQTAKEPDMPSVESSQTPAGEASTDTPVTWGFHPGEGNFDVELMDDGGYNRVKVIKEIRELTGFGLKESKELVDKVPSMVFRGVSEEDAVYAKGKLEAAGATVMVYETSAEDRARESAVLSNATTERKISTGSGYSSSPSHMSEAERRVYPGKGEWNVDITAVGPNKVKLIKVIRILTGLGLKEAKQVTDDAPCNFLRGLTSEDAEYARMQIESVGATARVY